MIPEVVLRRFDQPDEVRQFEKGRLEIVRLGGVTIGRATYEPGWKWSSTSARSPVRPFCEVEHVGLVVSGRATAAMIGGQVSSSPRHALPRPALAARQLGRRRRAVRLAALPRRRPLRAMTMPTHRVQRC